MSGKDLRSGNWQAESQEVLVGAGDSNTATDGQERSDMNDERIHAYRLEVDPHHEAQPLTTYVRRSDIERVVLAVLRQFIYRGRTDGAVHSVWTAMDRALTHTEADEHKWGGDREDFYRRGPPPDCNAEALKQPAPKPGATVPEEGTGVAETVGGLSAPDPHIVVLVDGKKMRAFGVWGSPAEATNWADRQALTAGGEYHVVPVCAHDPKDEERPQHNTLRGLPTQDPFREAVGDLVPLVEAVRDEQAALFREERIRLHGFPVGSVIADRARENAHLDHALAKVKAMLDQMQ